MTALSQGNMPSKTTAFSYQLTYSRGSALVVLLRRDAADLAARGVTPERIDALEALIEIAKNRPASAYYQMVVSEKAAAKNLARYEVMVVIEELRAMARNVFGAPSDMYARFGFINLDNLGANAFTGVVRMKLMASLHRYAADLAPQGYTTAMLTDLQTKLMNFNAALAEITAARSDAKEATRERIAGLNEIWAEVSDLASTGKAYYRRRNAGKYVEYGAITRRRTARKNKRANSEFSDDADGSE